MVLRSLLDHFWKSSEESCQDVTSNWPPLLTPLSYRPLSVLLPLNLFLLLSFLCPPPQYVCDLSLSLSLSPTPAPSLTHYQGCNSSCALGLINFEIINFFSELELSDFFSLSVGVVPIFSVIFKNNLYINLYIIVYLYDLIIFCNDSNDSETFWFLYASTLQTHNRKDGH